MTTTRRLALALGAAALSAPFARTAAAQGSLSTQGYGYPTGELSTRALGTGGSLAEFDPASPINPAALGSWGASPINSAIRSVWGRTAFTAQYDPEFRRVTAGTGSQTSAAVTLKPECVLVEAALVAQPAQRVESKLGQVWPAERVGAAQECLRQSRVVVCELVFEPAPVF